MSSFNINGPSSNQPMIQGSQNLGKDGGGGGSTGYMNMRKKKRGANHATDEDNSVFLEEEIEDTFEKEGRKKEKRGNKIIGAISGLIRKKTEDPIPDEAKDVFTKNEDISEDEDDDEDIENYSAYNVPLEKRVDPLEDDEYEIVDDDEYYNDIDV